MKKYLFVLVILIGFIGSSRAQAPDSTDSEIVLIAEQIPEFPGGQDALYEYLAKNVKYPFWARWMGVSGKVTCTFVVEKSGKISQVEVISKPIEYGLEKETKRVINQMPLWTPGYQSGKPVNFKYTLPIRFTLN